MGNVHYVGAEPLTFERIEEILTGNMKLELTPEVKERIQRCRDYLDRKIETQSEMYQLLQAHIAGKLSEEPCL